MTLATLSQVLQPALRDGYAVAGLVTLGWEDMRAYVAAAEAEGVPVILQAPGPVFVAVKVVVEVLPLVLPPRDGTWLKHRFRGALLGEAAFD